MKKSVGCHTTFVPHRVESKTKELRSLTTKMEKQKVSGCSANITDAFTDRFVLLNNQRSSGKLFKYGLVGDIWLDRCLVPRHL